MTHNTGPLYGTCNDGPEKTSGICSKSLALIHPLSTSGGTRTDYPKVVARAIKGERFNHLTIAWPAGITGKGHISFLAFCDCGKFIVTRVEHLRSGNTKSCGCCALKHGHARNGQTSPEYRSYCGAKSRCRNRRNIDYINYGGRGIQFKFSTFQEFLAELGPKPKPKASYSVDRIDNNGHYEPGNVRWATAKEQANNRSA